MIAITGAFHILLFAVCFGALASIIIFVPLFLYTIPYAWWLGGQNLRGKHLNLKSAPFFRSVKYASRLYNEAEMFPTSASGGFDFKNRR